MKTFLKIYISLSLILSPIFLINNANAASLGGWSMGNPVSQGASTVYNGTKQVIIDGTDYIKKGTAKITPTVSGVAKVLSRGAAAYALSIAVEQLLGAVDWVLDPANNRIVYHEKPQTTSKYRYENLEIYNSIGVRYVYTAAQAESAVRQFFSHINRTNYTWGGCSRIDNNFQCKWGFEGEQPTRVINFYPVANPNYTQEVEEKSIPLETVAQKVITNAESGDTNAQVATTTAAADIVAEAESDNVKARPIVQQLEASASTENADSAAQEAANEATGTSQPNTANPDSTDLKLSFPVFCGWAPVVCEAAQVAIQFPSRVQTWVNQGLVVGEKIETEQKATTAEAAKTATATQAINQELTNSNDLPQKDTSTVVLPDVPIVPQTVNVNWGNACPPPTTATLSIFGQSTEITLINYDPICQWAWVVEYSVIALASISSVFIVAGRKS
jgi:hypothetical protein